jgi:hypothetical protein
VYRQNKLLTDEKAIAKEVRKAKLGVAHVQLYVEKSAELTANYTNASEAFDNSLNPKDEHFVYF